MPVYSDQEVEQAVQTAQGKDSTNKARAGALASMATIVVPHKSTVLRSQHEQTGQRSLEPVLLRLARMR